MTPAERARLFAALPVPADVAASLRAELDRHPCGAGARRLRWSRPASWHVTLSFYGSDTPRERAERLRDRLAGVPAPVVRLEGAGSFPRVLWIGVHGEGLEELAAAARPERGPDAERAFRGHLTLARGNAPTAIAAWVRSLGSYRSAWWVGHEAVLFRSDPGPEESVYTPLERFPLGRPMR